MTETPQQNNNAEDPEDREGQEPITHLSTNALKIPLYGLFAIALLASFYVAHPIVLPIILAVLFSLLFGPLVRKAQLGLKVPPAVTALVLILGLLAGIAGLGYAVAPPVAKWVTKAPQGVSRLLTGESQVTATLKEVQKSAAKVEKSMGGTSENEPQAVVVESNSWQQQLLKKLRNGTTGLALALALSYFLLVSGDGLITNFVRQLPRDKRRMTLRVVRESQQQIAKYLAVISTSNFLVGLATGLLCWAIGLPTPAVWGIIAGLARFVPYLGVIGTVILLGIVSLATLDELWLIALAPLGYLGLTSLVGFFLEPYIHGFRMAINPVVIFVSIFFWGWLWGAVGVLLAVPLMTVIQVVLKQIPRLQPIYRVIAR